MEAPALPAAKITRRPDGGGAGKCACRQLAGCAAATAVRNRPSRKARGDAVKIYARVRRDDRGGQAWFQIACFAFGLSSILATSFNTPRQCELGYTECDWRSQPTLESRRLRHYSHDALLSYRGPTYSRASFVSSEQTEAVSMTH